MYFAIEVVAIKALETFYAPHTYNKLSILPCCYFYFSQVVNHLFVEFI